MENALLGSMALEKSELKILHEILSVLLIAEGVAV